MISGLVSVSLYRVYLCGIECDMVILPLHFATYDDDYANITI